MFDYHSDKFGRACLKEATKSKSDLGFGAILVKRGKIIGRGWNRRSTKEERAQLKYVDYGIHAEQACVADALNHGYDVCGAKIYVLGIALRGPNKDKLTTRKQKVFICKKCPPSILLRFNISVSIPHCTGWAELTPEDALKTAHQLCGDGYWKRFLKN